MKRTLKLFLILAAALGLALGVLTACGRDVKLRFFSDGAEIGVMKVAPGSEVEPPAPEKEGYLLDGWYLSSDFAGEGVSGVFPAPEQDASYYAKWEKGYPLTLETEGGTLSTRSLLLKSGANVYDAVKDLVPEYDGLTFGGWFEGERALSRTRVMPEEGLTLRAGYLADYTVEVYLERLLLDGYEKSAEFSFEAQGYFNSVVTESVTVPGFEYNPDYIGTVGEIKLTSMKELNVLRLYYDRSRCVVRYDANEPSGTAAGLTEADEALYEADYAAKECGFRLDGYYFLGWSTRRDGGVQYAAGETFAVTHDLTLYAVWQRGATDRFGGHDRIYLLDGGIALLERGGTYFEGVYSGGDAQEFSFRTPSGKTLEGRVTGNVFTYYLDDEAGVYYALSLNYAYDPALSEDDYLDRSATLSIGRDFSATLSAGGQSLRGELQFDRSAGDYLFTAEGGFACHCNFGEYTRENGETVNVFTIRGGEAEAAGYQLILPYGEQALVRGLVFLLDGYGTAGVYIADYETIAMGYYYLEGSYSTADGAAFYRVVLTLDDVMFSGEWEFYTAPMYDGTSVCVEREYDLAKTYDGADGDTLTLDGYGIFPDSATLSADGKTYTGSYRVLSSEVYGTTVSFTAYDEAGAVEGMEDVRFRLSGDSFAETAGQKGDFTEYRRIVYDEQEHSPAFADPSSLLLLYEEEGLAELFLMGESGYALAATGEYSAQTLPGGLVTLYTFTATESDRGVESFRFLVNYTTPDGGETFCHVYYLLEYNGVSQCETVESEGGDARIYLNMINLGMGSLYCAPDGTIYEGSFEVQNAAYFTDLIYGVFTWIDYAGGGYEEIRFEATLGGDGSVLSFRDTDREEIPVYYVDGTGLFHEYVDFIIDGVGQAIRLRLSDDGAPLDETFGAYEDTGERTCFGETVYRFVTQMGSELFRFLLVQRDYYQESSGILYEGLTCYYLSEEGADRQELAVSDGSVLVLDGWHTAQYTTADGRTVFGEYALSDGILTLTATDAVYSFRMAEGGLTLLDGVYGSYELVFHNNVYVVTFDGNGGISVRSSNPRFNPQGSYLLLDAATGECRLVVDLIYEGASDTFLPQVYRVRFHSDAFSGTTYLVMCDEETEGWFVDEDWNVLHLDGYGAGEYFAADGSEGRTGYLDVIDGEDGFAVINFEDFSYFNFLYDFETGRFERLDYSQFGWLYFSEALDGIEFGEDATLGNRSGPYYAAGDRVKVYSMDSQTGEFVLIATMPRPTGADVYEYEGTRYYLLREETEITLSGTVRVTDPDAQQSGFSAEISFTLPMDPWFNVPAVLYAQNRSYRLNLTHHFGLGRLCLMDEDYNYFPLDAHFIPGEESSFEAEGDYRAQRSLYDHYQSEAAENGEWDSDKVSLIETYYLGYGPVQLGEPEIHGTLYYEPLMDGDDPFVFTVKETDAPAVGYDASYGTRYQLTFEKDGTRYALLYSVYSGGFDLYLLVTYEEMNAGNYIVGVGKYVYSNRYQLSDTYETGALCSVSLFKREGTGRRAVKAYNSSVLNGTEAWMVDMGSLTIDDSGMQTGALGSAYYFTFDFAANTVEVGEYGFRQGITRTASHFVNFLLDESGEVARIAALAVGGADGYLFVSIDSVTENADGSYTVTSGQTRYIVRFVLDEAGEKVSLGVDETGAYVPSEDGEFWQIEVSRA